MAAVVQTGTKKYRKREAARGDQQGTQRPRGNVELEVQEDDEQDGKGKASEHRTKGVSSCRDARPDQPGRQRQDEGLRAVERVELT